MIDERVGRMEKAIAIGTCLGVLRGRDCIDLNWVKQDDVGNMTFTGDINGHSVSKHTQKRWVPYELTFQRVLACFSCELDTYENLVETNYLDDSDFALIENSTWLQSLPVRKDFKKDMYKHYRLFTYDVVYNIIAVSYKLQIDI